MYELRKKVSSYFYKIANNGITEEVSFSEKRHLQVINLFSVTNFFVSITGATLYFIIGKFPIYPKYLIGIVEFAPLLSFYLIKYQKYTLAKISIIFSINLGWYVMIANYGVYFVSFCILTNTLFSALILDMNKFRNWYIVIFLNILLAHYNFLSVKSIAGISENDTVHFLMLLTSIVLITSATFYFKRSVDNQSYELMIKQKKLMDNEQIEHNRILETEKVKFEIFFNSILESIILINKTSKKIEEFNSSFSQLFKYSKEEIVNLKITDILLDHPSFEELKIDNFISNEGEKLNLIGICKNRISFEAEVNIYTFFYKEKSYYLYIIRDISERVNKEKLIQEKQRALIDITKKMEETKLIALRLQMNPHFVFNSLNSIQGKIALDKKKEALVFLSAFSKLIRKKLELSDKSVINLETEIELLELYLQLESNRIGDSFSYTINIDSREEISNYEVPPMIIQPYIENAIWHGLFHKIGEKKLDIKFHLSEFQLICIITDNGIGREAASKYKKSQESRGMSNTIERLRLFGLTYDKKVNVEIGDIFENGKSGGTKVIISINSKHKFQL